MECTSPLFRYVSPEKFKGARLLKDGSYDRFYSLEGLLKDSEHFKARFDSKIGCGSCAVCRLKASAERAMRIMHESKNYKHNYFITLTYDDDFLRTTSEITGNPLLDPYDWYECFSQYFDAAGHMFNLDSGELTVATFWKRDLVDFMKRLRAHYSYYDGIDGIRFFASGEYGEISNRPHFHVILLNAPDLSDSFKLWQRGKYTLYESELLKDFWKLGRVIVGDLTFETAAYTARYVMKKITGKALEGLPLDDLPYQPWANGSRRPGIGSDFVVDRLDDLLEDNKTFLIRGDRAIVKSLPRFYINKLEQLSDPGAFARFKEKRATASVDRKAKLFDQIYEGNYLDLETMFKCEQERIGKPSVVRSQKVLRKI